MKALFLTLFVFVLSFTAYSQSFLGKSKEEIKKIAYNLYDEVEIIEESENSITLQCDTEINQFVMTDEVCTKFNSTKSYKCNCLDGDLQAYNNNLKSLGSMKWINNEGDKFYEIQLKNSEYIVSISDNNSQNLTAFINN